MYPLRLLCTGLSSVRDPDCVGRTGNLRGNPSDIDSKVIVLGAGAMPYGDLIFGLSFFAAFAAYLFFGLHVIHNDPEAAPNRVFFALCVAGCLWAFGLSLANCAPTYTASLMWWRVSALGSCTFFGFLPHFPLALRAKKFSPWGRRAICVLHVPALWCLWGCAVSSQLAEAHYDLVRTPYGWLNVGRMHGLSRILAVYRALCILGTICAMWFLLKRRNESLFQRRLKIALRLLLVGTCLSVLTDVVLASHPSYSLPHMTPILMVAPVAAMYYAAGYQGGSSVIKEGLILSQQTRHKLQFYLGCTYVFGGVLVFANQYFPELTVNKDLLAPTVQTGVMLFLLGFMILAVQRVADRKIADALTLGILLFSIPLITLRFVQFGSITVWAFPLVMILVSLMYDGRVPLFLVTVVSIVTQLAVWAMAPKSPVLVDEFDHVLRMGMFLIAFWVGSFVNRTYIYRLKESISKVQSQELISEVSFSFVGIDSQNVDDKILGMLDSLGRFFRVDRVCLSLSLGLGDGKPPSYRWSPERTSTEAGLGDGHGLPSWCWQRLNGGHGIFVNDASALPHSQSPCDNETKSFALFPVSGNERLLGYMALCTTQEPRSWSAEDERLLGILGNLLSDGLIRVRAEREIEQMAYYDHLTGLPNRHLFSEQLEHAIGTAKPGESIAVLFVDLDSFKVLNDTMGHDKGDTVLRDIGTGIARAVGPKGVVARFGGDEFLIMVPKPSYPRGIEKVAEEVMGLFGTPFFVDGREFFVTASAGVAVYPFDGADAVTLVKNADIAMYVAKAMGRTSTLCAQGT